MLPPLPPPETNAAIISANEARIRRESSAAMTGFRELSQATGSSPRMKVPETVSMDGGGQELHQLRGDSSPTDLNAAVLGAPGGAGGSIDPQSTSTESSQPHSPKPVNSRLASLRRLQPPSHDINGSVGKSVGDSGSGGHVITSPLNIDLGGTIFASDAEIGNLIEQISGLSKRSRPVMAPMIADGGLEPTAALKGPFEGAGLGM